MGQGPLLLPPGRVVPFPDPRGADEDGLVAIGGDLSTRRLLLAYESGVFPWSSSGLPPLWWSPDPRAVMDAERLHVSRSLRRVLQRGGFVLSWNRAFEAVMRACGRDREDGTWILPEMIDAYVALHRLGHAHSLEVWSAGALVGGLYGVQRGALFAAESMFHTQTNASKIALVAAVQSLFSRGISLFDVQFLTPHLGSLGAYEISRVRYLARLGQATSEPVDLRSVVPLVRKTPE
jgi:leucyl/phenylalanyl-tRNA---protein transferase